MFSCPRIINDLAINYLGEIDACSIRSESISSGINIHSNTVDEYRQSDYHKKLAESTDWPKGCELCKKDEEIGIHSMRMDRNNHDRKNLHVNIGNLCNSDCIMCKPILSTKIAARLHKHPDTLGAYATDTYHGQRSLWQDQSSRKNLLEAIFSTDDLVISGGEPMLDPSLWKILAAAKPETEVRIITNGSCYLTDDKADLLKRFSKIFVTTSIDATGLTYEWIRQGLRWQQLLKNLVRLKSIPWITTILNVVVQAHTISDLPNLLRFSNRTNLNISYIILANPKILRPNNAPLWVLEDTLSKLKEMDNSDDLSKILTDCIANHDPLRSDQLRDYTRYLNAHRSNEFDWATWQVVRKST